MWRWLPLWMLVALAAAIYAVTAGARIYRWEMIVSEVMVCASTIGIWGLIRYIERSGR
jgi:hypothetical protein